MGAAAAKAGRGHGAVLVGRRCLLPILVVFASCTSPIMVPLAHSEPCLVVSKNINPHPAAVLQSPCKCGCNSSVTSPCACLWDQARAAVSCQGQAPGSCTGEDACTSVVLVWRSAVLPRDNRAELAACPNHMQRQLLMLEPHLFHFRPHCPGTTLMLLKPTCPQMPGWRARSTRLRAPSFARRASSGVSCGFHIA